MKSEMEMQTALAGLVLLMHEGKSESDRKRAKFSADMVLWALDYPCEFEEIFEKIKALEMPMENISKDIKKIVANYKPPEDPDTHTE